MTILPRFLFVVQTIPIQLPDSFFALFRKACSTFIWQNKPPRAKYSRLTLPKSKGGIGLPDLQRYHWAVHLARIVDWNVHHRIKDWINLEQAVFSQHLRTLPWLLPQHISLAAKSHPFINPTLHFFSRTQKRISPTPWRGPLTPLRNNPDLTSQRCIGLSFL